MIAFTVISRAISLISQLKNVKKESRQKSQVAKIIPHTMITVVTAQVDTLRIRVQECVPKFQIVVEQKIQRLVHCVISGPSLRMEPVKIQELWDASKQHLMETKSFAHLACLDTIRPPINLESLDAQKSQLRTVARFQTLQAIPNLSSVLPVLVLMRPPQSERSSITNV